MRCAHDIVDPVAVAGVADCYVCAVCRELVRPVIGKVRKNGTFRRYFVLYRGR